MGQFNYTQRARRFANRYPVWNVIGKQVTFWILANIVLAILLHLMFASVNENIQLPLPPRLGPTVVIAIIIGFFYGLVQGSTDYLLGKQFFRNRSLGITFLLKIVVSLLTLSLLFALVRFVLYEHLVLPLLLKGRSPLNEASWKYTFYIFLVYYAMMTLVITFITQVNNKYGPGVLVPLLLGKYRQPREEERIFMFMDLQSSTSIAEQLGHIRYSSFIRDAFMDINQVLAEYNAEIYQYVGDEIVLSWRITEGMRQLACLRFYFACVRQFEKRKEYYIDRYGMVPFFKAGVHMGPVMAVEIGEIKRDIAYHGDTLNTAARIQSLCNTYNQQLLISNLFCAHEDFERLFVAASLGEVMLKGKKLGVEVLGVGEREESGRREVGK